MENAIFVEDVLGQGKVEDPDVMEMDIRCMLEPIDCPIKRDGHVCDGTTEVHACSSSNCKRVKKLYTCNEMQKFMLGTGSYKAMKTCITHRTAVTKSQKQPDRPEKNRCNMRENVNRRNNPRNNKGPRMQYVPRSFARRNSN